MRDCSPLDALSNILCDVPDLVFAYSLDGRYLFVNRAAAEFLDCDPLDVIGHTWRELGYPADIMEPLFDAVLGVAETRDPVHYRVVTSPIRGGRTLDIALTPLRSEDDEVLAVLAIAHDISEFF